MNKKVYISGSFSKDPVQAKLNFKSAQLLIESMGLTAVNPFEINHDEKLIKSLEASKQWEVYMRGDIGALVNCDAIYVIGNDYTQSRGATLEIYIANQIGIPVYYENWKHKLSELINAKNQ